MRRFGLILAPMLLIVTFPCRAEMQIGGTPVMVLCQEAANASWDLWNERLAEKPYNPGWFAWGLSHALRAFIRLYNISRDRLWFDRAVYWVDYLANYSDVNGDGIPAWGNYNETWGTDSYDFAEHTVHDGVICTPIMELVCLVYRNEQLRSDPSLRSKADMYISLVRAVIDGHHSYWTDLTPDSGYYWRTPTNDDMIIINQFAALGIAEMMLADILGNASYLERPERMANLIKSHLQYDEDDDCYTWQYSVGGRVEDTSHAGIDLEFMILAHSHGLAFDDQDMERLVNTYQRKLWRGVDMYRTGIGIASYVDGGLDPDSDYTRLSKVWPSLCLFDPRILEQHRLALEVMAETRMPKDRVMARILAEMLELERTLEDMGVDVESLMAFEDDTILQEIGRINTTVADAEAIGANMNTYRALVDDLYAAYEERMRRNVSSLLHTIWDTMESVEKARAEGYVTVAEAVVDRARNLGIDTSRHELFLNRAKQSLEQGYYESAVNMCAYPLRLEEMIEEGLPSTLAFLALFWGVGALRRHT